MTIEGQKGEHNDACAATCDGWDGHVCWQDDSVQPKCTCGLGAALARAFADGVASKTADRADARKKGSRIALQEVTRNMGPLELPELRFLAKITAEYIADAEAEAAK